MLRGPAGNGGATLVVAGPSPAKSTRFVDCDFNADDVINGGVVFVDAPRLLLTTVTIPADGETDPLPPPRYKSGVLAELALFSFELASELWMFMSAISNMRFQYYYYI
jgi:hypothetical protein